MIGIRVTIRNRKYLGI